MQDLTIVHYLTTAVFGGITFLIGFLAGRAKSQMLINKSYWNGQRDGKEQLKIELADERRSEKMEARRCEVFQGLQRQYQR